MCQVEAYVAEVRDRIPDNQRKLRVLGVLEELDVRAQVRRLGVHVDVLERIHTTDRLSLLGWSTLDDRLWSAKSPSQLSSRR